MNPVEPCWKNGKYDRRLGAKFHTSFKDFKKAVTLYYRTRKFNKNLYNYLCLQLYVSIPPYLSVSKLVQYLKGKTSRKIQFEFPELRKRYWGKHIWAVGYFVRTTGNVTDEMIKQYIKHHGKDDQLRD